MESEAPRRIQHLRCTRCQRATSIKVFVRLRRNFEAYLHWELTVIQAIESEAGMACSLSDKDLTERLSLIAGLARRHLLAERDEGLTLRLQYAPAAAPELRQLVALERQCCRFLNIELQESADRVDLAVSAPPEASATAAMLFAHFRGVTPDRSMRTCAGSGCGCTP